MFRSFCSRSKTRSVSVYLSIAIAAWLALGGTGTRSAASPDSPAALRQVAADPRLVSVAPLPPGQMCQWVSASTNTIMRNARFQSPVAGRKTADTQPRTSIVIDRAPVRVIQDSYPTYSAVGVDLTSNEVYLQDENLFGLAVFDRMTNTPPTASFSEPKRLIRGHNTGMEFNCALYVDPSSGDVYSVNNDMMDHMVVFPRGANGDVAPKRRLHTPHQTFGVAVDEATQELYLTVQGGSVVVYRKTAEGEEKPLRILRGGRTRLEDPHGIALDTKNNWMFVANHGSTSRDGTRTPSITVYPLKANGDIPPVRIIEGSNTQLNWPALMTIDEGRGELYVANDVGNSVLVFRTTDSGDAAPSRVIRGPKTGLMNPTGLFLDVKNKELWVANFGNHSSTVFPQTANGDVAPLRTIRSAPAGKIALMIGNPGAVGYDTKREEIIVPN